MIRLVKIAEVVIPLDAAPPYRQAAAVIGNALALPIREAAQADSRALNIGPPEFGATLAGVPAYLAEAPSGGRWDLIYETDEHGWLVTGARPLHAAHAGLFLLDLLRENSPQPHPWRQLRKAVFATHGIDFDDWSFGFAREADGFDLTRHIQDAVRIGIENFEINRLADVVPVQVRERLIWQDKYQWWHTYAAALDMFVESTLNKGTYSRELLQRNMATLQETAALCRHWGLALRFTAFEPRTWPERLFAKYPELRGARVDCADYSAEAAYAPDVNHPLVQEHYAEMTYNLMCAVPDLESFSVWSQDSGAGFPWAHKLYPGANGPRAARRHPVGETVAAFMTNLYTAARKVNPAVRTSICLSWFVQAELEEILKCLPKEIECSFTVPSLPGPAQSGKGSWTVVDRIRQLGWDPEVQRENVANPWKPLGPVQGIPFPWLCHDMLADMVQAGQVRKLLYRGGVETDVFVPGFINNEVIRSFLFTGPGLDIDSLLKQKAAAWTTSAGEAAALLQAWSLSDQVVRHFHILAWTFNFVSGRTLFRSLVRPIVPDQSLLKSQESDYWRYVTFLVGASDPGWVDFFYKGWTRMVKDQAAEQEAENHAQTLLPRLTQAVAALAPFPDSVLLADLRNRLQAFRHILATERNIMITQVSIHRCLADDRAHPEKSPHVQALRDAIDREIANTRAFAQLLDAAAQVLIPETSGEETVYMYKAPLVHQLRHKAKVMAAHRNDIPGPWFAELEQPGGYNSAAAPGAAPATGIA